MAQFFIQRRLHRNLHSIARKESGTDLIWMAFRLLTSLHSLTSFSWIKVKACRVRLFLYNLVTYVFFHISFCLFISFELNLILSVPRTHRRAPAFVRPTTVLPIYKYKHDSCVNANSGVARCNCVPTLNRTAPRGMKY